MVDIIFANSCDKLMEFRTEDYVEETLSNLGHILQLSKENLFLVTLKGEVCENGKRIQDYIQEVDKKVLILFQRNCIITDVLLDQFEISEFNVYPEGYEYLYRFDVSNLISGNDEKDVIKTNEEILFEITENSRAIYVDFYTMKENILKNIEFMKNRKRIVKSLFNMSENYLNSLGNAFDILRDQFNIAQREGKNMIDKLKNQSSDGLLLRTLVQVQEDFKNIGQRYPESIRICINEMKKDLEFNENCLIRIRCDFNEISSLKKSLVEELCKIEGEIDFVLMKTHNKYNKFSENLTKLTDFDYHPKTVIAKKLMQSEKIYSLFSHIEQMSQNQKILKNYQNSLKPIYDRIEPNYKNLLNSLFTFITKFTFSAKKKFDAFKRKLSIHIKKQKTLTELFKSPALESKLQNLKEIPTNQLESSFKSIIFEKLENLRIDQLKFLEQFGNSLPSRFFMKVLQKMVIKEVPKEEIVSLEQRVQINTPYCSEEEIKKFYQEQLKILDMHHEQGLKRLKESVRDVEVEVETINSSIEDLLIKKKNNQDLLINTFEEKSLFTIDDKENIEKSLSLKSSFLKFRYNSLKSKKMTLLQHLRAKNKIILNPFNTPC